MKVKVLKIRISDQYQNMDEAVINDYFERYDIITINTKFIEDDINFWSILLHYNDKSHIQKSEDQLSEEEMIIYNKLKIWRSEKSQELKLPSYIIFHNTHLMSIAKFKPSNVEELEHVSGLGKTKIEKFGTEILEVLENA